MIPVRVTVSHVPELLPGLRLATGSGQAEWAGAVGCLPGRSGFLRGWAGYFRYGNSARQFDKISTFAVARLALFLAKRHKRSRAWGWRLVAYQAPDRLGLISFTGTVAAPRPIWGWRARPNTAGERRR